MWFVYLFIFLNFIFVSDIFSLGFGPFRWVCTSGDPTDLTVTDELALHVLDSQVKRGGVCVCVSVHACLCECVYVYVHVCLCV